MHGTACVLTHIENTCQVFLLQQSYEPLSFIHIEMEECKLISAIEPDFRFVRGKSSRNYRLCLQNIFFLRREKKILTVNQSFVI